MCNEKIEQIDQELEIFAEAASNSERQTGKASEEVKQYLSKRLDEHRNRSAPETPTGIWAKCEQCEHAWPLVALPMTDKGRAIGRQRHPCPECSTNATLMVGVRCRLIRKLTRADLHYA